MTGVSCLHLGPRASCPQRTKREDAKEREDSPRISLRAFALLCVFALWTNAVPDCGLDARGPRNTAAVVQEMPLVPPAT